jgi:WD40 repeat protein
VTKLRNDESKVLEFILGLEPSKEIWGGVGISCIDWSPLEDNLLAAVTLKTDRLEIWDVQKGVMLAILDLKGKIINIKWSPNDNSTLIAR